MTATLTPLIRIVDDDAELRESQKMLLETLGWEVQTYPNAVTFLQDDSLIRPGCIILDVRMPSMTGLELQQELEKRHVKNIAIIFLSAHGDISMAVHTLQHGAMDFLEKPVEPHILLQRVATAIAKSIQLNARQDEIDLLKSRVEKLSTREREVALLVSQGMRNKSIAQKLGIEESTVKMHRANAVAKLAVSSTAELTRIFTILEILDKK